MENKDLEMQDVPVTAPEELEEESLDKVAGGALNIFA